MTDSDYWGQGDYHEVARRLQPAADALVRLAGIGPSDRVLDVAAGTGNVAIAAARAGASAVATDLSPALLARGERRSRDRRLDVEWRIADAAALPFADAEFDAALSAFGVIYVPDAAAAARELFRVLRPDGVVGVTIWSTGFQQAIGRAIEQVLTTRSSSTGEKHPLAGEAAFDWSRPDDVVGLFAPYAVTVEVVPGSFAWCFSSFAAWLSRAEEVAPPLIALRKNLDAASFDDLRVVIERAAEPFVRTVSAGVVIDQAYTAIIARKA